MNVLLYSIQEDQVEYQEAASYRTMSGLIESCMNPLEKANVLKTIRSSGVDFNELTPKRKRR